MSRVTFDLFNDMHKQCWYSYLGCQEFISLSFIAVILPWLTILIVKEMSKCVHFKKSCLNFFCEFYQIIPKYWPERLLFMGMFSLTYTNRNSNIENPTIVLIIPNLSRTSVSNPHFQLPLLQIYHSLLCFFCFSLSAVYGHFERQVNGSNWFTMRGKKVLNR